MRKRIARTGVVVTGVLLSALAAAAPSLAAQPAIIDGSDAGSLHSAARMFAGGQEICSATIIAPDWILTARHCTQGADGKPISFHVGDLDQTKGTTVNATSVHEAPDSDIALVQIDQQVQTEYAPLGSEGDVKVGDQAEVYGWGATCTDKPEIECQSQLLKVAKVSVSSIDCPDGAAGVSVCANRGDGITAGGDSGGPMYAGGKQVGVASTSDRQSYTAYINITKYRDWISATAGV
ncbi:trypsin-like serine protease [Amycolatopsis sp. NPDC005961]|uniref:Trypsin-like protease n=1 Tax=Amycolatopsis camponoti TaxID=2606593 RepID=A0A6I8LSA8_9PSEU|nr:trypsin-like serine protease [Amycolatopsis camponoti]VVJ18797.1 Trypsin-like protease [Amycolatopsis camponoti]